MSTPTRRRSDLARTVYLAGAGAAINRARAHGPDFYRLAEDLLTYCRPELNESTDPVVRFTWMQLQRLVAQVRTGELDDHSGEGEL